MPGVIEKFVASFGAFDPMDAADVDLRYRDRMASLIVRPAATDGATYWRPIAHATPRARLDEIYETLRITFPPLFEQLVLSYRWAEVDLGRFTLLANAPADDLKPFAAAIVADGKMWEPLRANGYARFAIGPDYDYDAVCFDRRDGRVLKVDHEEILCNRRIREKAELAPSWEQLMELVIRDAEEARSRGAWLGPIGL